MKTIKTGYFRRIQDYENMGLIPVSIALTKSRYSGPVLEFKALAPSKSLLERWKDGRIDKAQYEREFYAQLSKLKPAQILNRLPDNAVLLCYEKAVDPEDWCHRHMVTKWLEEHLEIKVEEA